MDTSLRHQGSLALGDPSSSAGSSSRLSTLRAALFASSSTTQTPAMPVRPTRTSPPTSRLQPSHSASNSIVPPLAKIAIGGVSSTAADKEEGEISDDEPVPISLPPRKESLSKQPVHRNAKAGPSRPAVARAGPSRQPETGQRIAPKFSSSAKRTPLPTTSSPPAPSHPLKHASPSPTVSTPPSNGGSSIAAAPNDLSPTAARQYMAHIRDLLNDGVPPDSLIRRGATSKYVTAVCEEIVVGTKERQALWFQPRDTRADSESSSAVLIASDVQHIAHVGEGAGASEHRAGSSSIDMVRARSHGSESSAEGQLLPSLSPAKPAPQPLPPSQTLRLTPTSTWTPTPGRNRAVRIEPAKPDQSSVSTYTQSNAVESVPSSLTGSLPPLAATAAVDSATRDALLLARRRALASMRLRRANGSPEKSPSLLPVASSTLGTPDHDSSAQKAIEQQVDALEKEMMALQSPGLVPVADTAQLASRVGAVSPSSVQMEIDLSPEEGEIFPSPSLPPPVAQMVSTSWPVASSVPIPRGIKRPGAADFESRPTSSKSLPLRRRTIRAPFAEQNPTKLLINLDEADSDSDSEVDGSGVPGRSDRMIPVIHVPGVDLETDKLLREKDAEIQRLKAEIKRRMEASRIRGNGRSPAAPGGDKAATPVPDLVPQATESHKVPIQEVKEVEMQDDSEPRDTQVIASPYAAETEEKQETATALQSEEPKTEASERSLAPPHFKPYQPLLPRYPGLMTSRLASTALPSFKPAPSSSSATEYGAQGIDADLMRSIVLTRLERTRLGAVLCPAETAGGMCADAKCENVHLLSGRGIDIMEADVVEYLLSTSPIEVDGSTARRALDKAAGVLEPRGLRGKQKQNLGSSGLSVEILANTDKLDKLVRKARDILALPV